MKQLGQLQGRYEDFKKKQCEIIAVFREEKLGGDGLKRSRKNCKAEFVLLNDYQAKTTPAYSKGEYNTYLVDKKGVVRAALEGSKRKRPLADVILDEVDKL